MATVNERPSVNLGGNQREQGYNTQSLVEKHNQKALVINRKNSYGKDVPYFTGC